MVSSYDEISLLREKLSLLEREKLLREGLGYRYAHKWYSWQEMSG